MSRSHATELQYHPADNVTRAGGSLQTTQDDGEGLASEASSFPYAAVYLSSETLTMSRKKPLLVPRTPCGGAGTASVEDPFRHFFRVELTAAVGEGQLLGSTLAKSATRGALPVSSNLQLCPRRPAVGPSAPRSSWGPRIASSDHAAGTRVCPGEFLLYFLTVVAFVCT